MDKIQFNLFIMSQKQNICACVNEGKQRYIETRFQKSWDTVQIVNKNRMQWCGSFKFQYFIQNTTLMTYQMFKLRKFIILREK